MAMKARAKSIGLLFKEAIEQIKDGVVSNSFCLHIIVPFPSCFFINPVMIETC